MNGKADFFKLSAFLWGALIVVASLPHHTFAEDTEPTKARAKITTLENELGVMLAEPKNTLRADQIAAQRNLYNQKLNELNNLKSKHQAVTVVPARAKDEKVTAPTPSHSP